MSELNAIDLIKFDWYLGKLSGGVCNADRAKLFFSETIRAVSLSGQRLNMNTHEVNSAVASNMYANVDCVVVQINNLNTDKCYRGWSEIVIKNNKMIGFVADSLVENTC